LSDVFVFGSNLQGRHGKGAALHALKYFGAIYGIGEGRQGNSYAIPTKETPYKSLPLVDIQKHINKFFDHAKEKYWESFHVTPIGCGLAGYTPKEIAPMFRNAPENINLPQSFLDILNEIS